eukprot:790758-Alexandrium_andersonii.AAC.1
MCATAPPQASAHHRRTPRASLSQPRPRIRPPPPPTWLSSACCRWLRSRPWRLRALQRGVPPRGRRVPGAGLPGRDVPWPRGCGVGITPRMRRSGSRPGLRGHRLDSGCARRPWHLGPRQGVPSLLLSARDLGWRLSLGIPSLARRP